jgi:cation diffusion facilitator CzcD-associated flavoprotein CzcO
VVGAGPAGLAVASELGCRRVHALVLDRGRGAGEVWRGHYDRLRLNTVRWLSHLPQDRLPRRFGRGWRATTSPTTWLITSSIGGLASVLKLTSCASSMA